MKKKIHFLLFAAGIVFSSEKVFAQCCDGTAGHVCMGAPIFTIRGTYNPGTEWKSFTTTQTGFHRFRFLDSVYTTMDDREMFIQIKTCSKEDLQIQGVSSAGIYSQAIKRNTNNWNCGSNANDEIYTFLNSSGEALHLYVLGDSCSGTTRYVYDLLPKNLQGGY